MNEIMLYEESKKHPTNHVVTYANGETAVLQWSSWSYGIVACPILISMGSGPLGQLEIVP